MQLNLHSAWCLAIRWWKHLQDNQFPIGKNRSFWWICVPSTSFNQSIDDQSKLCCFFYRWLFLTFFQPQHRHFPRPHHRVHAGAGTGSWLVFPLPRAGCGGALEKVRKSMGFLTRISPRIWEWDGSKVKSYEFTVGESTSSIQHHPAILRQRLGFSGKILDYLIIWLGNIRATRK